ncbi:MAG TPA: hypothetical protein VLK84_23440 [Longimicrobium sp.]|nr:hypothetical protein [Longimicrobium sp.]
MRVLHPAFDRLRAFADGEEADGDRARRTAAHLRDCAACRARVTAFRERRTALREATTLAPPPLAWDRIVARREAGEELLLPAGPVPLAVPEARAETGGRASILRRAAVLLVGVAGIASATVPGSPVRAWLGAVLGGGAETAVTPAATPPADSASASTAATPPAPVESGPVAGIAVLPSAGDVRVVVVDAHPALRIRVRLTDTGRAEVRGRGAAADAGFASGRGRITVTGARGGGELEVLLPRGARRASLTVDGRRYVTLDDGHLTVLVPADSSGAEIVFPARP